LNLIKNQEKNSLNKIGKFNKNILKFLRIKKDRDQRKTLNSTLKNNISKDIENKINNINKFKNNEETNKNRLKNIINKHKIN
jgi:hypothetical protein